MQEEGHRQEKERAGRPGVWPWLVTPEEGQLGGEALRECRGGNYPVEGNG